MEIVSEANTTDDHLDQLERLVKQRLMERTDGLSPAALSAFVDGWVSLLEVLRRHDLTLPEASPEVRDAVTAIVERIAAAQAQVLDEDA